MSSGDFQSAINEELYFVYLIVHATAPRFKLGVSWNPAERARKIGHPFDLNKSKQFGFPKSEAYRIESRMRKKYSAFKIDPDVVGFSSGQTEWLDLGCFDECELSIHSENWVVPVGQISSRPWVRMNRAEMSRRGITKIDGLPTAIAGETSFWDVW